ncbi:MAG: hypothetical protein IPJ74_05440 [Saprospiraceae bacterium]|nr:hypothetical protein [Saprospiraceae bacterium]
MKTKIIFSFLCSIFLLQNFSFSQNFLDHTFFTLGFALSEQDRRLFEFPGAEGVLERENNKLDYEYNFTLQKSIIKLNLFQINAGIGYAEYNSTFSRPFSHRALNSGVTKELRYIKRYTINKLIFPISTNLFLTKNKMYF